MLRHQKFIIASMLLTFAAFAIQPDANAKPQFNAPRAPGEPGWAGRVFLRGDEKATKNATPVLEREYRPLHVVGNMKRRHHYRDTIIRSQVDRSDKRQAFIHAHSVRNRYRE